MVSCSSSTNGEPNMHHYIIEAMVSVLKPTLKNRRRAEEILEKFWQDKIALVRDVQDVHSAANEREVALTKKQAIKVIQQLNNLHDKQIGLRCKELTSYIENYCP